MGLFAINLDCLEYSNGILANSATDSLDFSLTIGQALTLGSTSRAIFDLYPHSHQLIDKKGACEQLYLRIAQKL